MRVLLLKEPRDEESGPDPYLKVEAHLSKSRRNSSNVIDEMVFMCHFLHLKELESHGHKATLIPVLSFKFVSLNTFSDKVRFITKE